MAEPTGARQRLFVAVPVPGHLVEFVREAQGLLPCLPGLRFLRPEQLHVTLAFIGEVGEGKAAAARAVVESVPADMGGSGVFGGFLLLPSPRKARVVALSITDEGGAFAALYERVMSGLEAAGVMKREKRPFRAHVTVARLRSPGLVQPTSESGRARFAVESVCLFESALRREGAEYTVLARTVFTKPERQGTA
jgi:RNA 2',3'-cyclic 3'-phosphodiesterase